MCAYHTRIRATRARKHVVHSHVYMHMRACVKYVFTHAFVQAQNMQACTSQMRHPHVLQACKHVSDRVLACFVGGRGKIGIPGLNGLVGQNGFDGPPGPQGSMGPQGLPGASGPQGEEGSFGHNGQRGARGRIGTDGTKGPTGPGGLDGDEPDAGSWRPSRYFCPGGGTKYARLVDCTTASCRFETQYNGEWGTVCDIGFTSSSARVACKGLGFEEGGVARRRGGGTGNIWLSRVRCKGDETDIGDCPNTCGGAGCNHAFDVGLCCDGFNTGPWGDRKAKRSHYTTLKPLRDHCYTPDTCVPASEDSMVTLAAGSHFDKRYWVTKLSVGDYAYISRTGQGVDNDKEMCVEKTCNMRPGQLSSMDVPEGYSVTLYSRDYFKGHSITYVGPVKVNDLVWEKWNDRTYSLKIASAKKRKRSAWHMELASTSAHLSSLPTSTLSVLNWVGEATVPFVNLHGVNEFRKYVSGTPSRHFAATFYGSLKVMKAGKYKFCMRSTDGSKLWVNDKEIINNDGRHGIRAEGEPYAPKPCEMLKVNPVKYSAAGALELSACPAFNRAERTSIFDTVESLIHACFVMHACTRILTPITRFAGTGGRVLGQYHWAAVLRHVCAAYCAPGGAMERRFAKISH